MMLLKPPVQVRSKDDAIEIVDGDGAVAASVAPNDKRSHDETLAAYNAIAKMANRSRVLS